MMRDDATRDRFLETLRVRRLEEACAVVALGRDVVVEFEGIYEGASAGEWRLGAVRVLVPEGVWSGQEPSVGSAVRVRAHAAGGALKASEVECSGPAAGQRRGEPATSGGIGPRRCRCGACHSGSRALDAQPTVPHGATSDGTRPAAPGARPEPGGDRGEARPAGGWPRRAARLRRPRRQPSLQRRHRSSRRQSQRPRTRTLRNAARTPRRRAGHGHRGRRNGTGAGNVGYGDAEGLFSAARDPRPEVEGRNGDPRAPRWTCWYHES